MKFGENVYRRATALQGESVLAKVEDDILQTT